MSIRRTPFVEKEFYHIFNRGTDKRKIFMDAEDMQRFFQSMEEFNVADPIGSIFENSFRKKSSLGSEASKLSNSRKKLVNFVGYCLNPNHYHFILEQVADRGIEKFMHRLSTGYTKYFNNKYKRSGVLFQGPFKAVHIGTNEQLLYVSAYVNLNFKVHRLGSEASKSSWDEYIGKGRFDFCQKNSVLGQFQNKKEYKEFAEHVLPGILKRKEISKELE